MTDIEKLEARLANTERALFALATILDEIQPPFVQNDITRLMNDYYDANTSLGFEPGIDFVHDNCIRIHHL
jgi:hypothetical protein